MKIAIVGAGAMGSILGAHFILGGAKVYFIDPFEAHIKAMQENGLKIRINQEEPRNLKVTAVTSADQITEKMDLILFMVKGLYTASAAESARKLADEKTYCMTLQNGVGNAEILAEYYNRQRILAGIVEFGGRIEEPGSVSALINPAAKIAFASTTEEEPDEFMQETADTLVRAGLKAFAMKKSQIDAIIWFKLAKNCSGNPICAVTRLPLGPYNNTEEGLSIEKAVFEEVEAVANAQGIKLADQGAPHKIPKESQMYYHLPSTAQDVKAKKKTEIDFINGAVVRLGERYGVPTPYNHMIAALVKIIEQNYDNQF